MLETQIDVGQLTRLVLPMKMYSVSSCENAADNNPLLAVGKISEPVVQRIYDESIGSRRSEANGLCERAQLTDDQMGHAKYLQ